jgi:hypothetical protein
LSAGIGLPLLRVERKVELENIYPWLAKKTKLWAFGILAKVRLYQILRHASGSGNASGLEFRVSCADMGIKTAS